MILRSVPWLLALVAIGAVLSLDRDPSDPARTEVSVAPGKRLALVVSHARLPWLLSEYDPKQLPASLPRQLAVYYGLRPATLGYGKVLEALALAQDRNLREPVVVPEFFLEVDRFNGVLLPVCVFPTWDLEALLPQFRQAQLGATASAMLMRDVSLKLYSGAAVAVGPVTAFAELAAFWQAYRKGLGAADVEEIESSTEGKYPQFYPIYPHDNPERQNRSILISVHSRQRGVTHLYLHLLPGGMVLCDTAEQQTLLRQSYDHPGLIQLSLDLQFGSDRRRASARRVAITGDDPDLTTFAWLDLILHNDFSSRALGDAPEELLRYWPPPSPGSELVDHFECPIQILERLPPRLAAQELTDLVRTTLTPDRMVGLLDSAFGHRMPELRQAAREAFLARLPRLVLFRESQALLPLTGSPDEREVGWPLEERGDFFDALVERLYEELRHGDFDRGVEVAFDAVECVHGLQTTSKSAAASRLTELGAALIRDGRHRPLLRPQQHCPQGIAIAAIECLHDSDPEVRREACRLLAERSLWQELSTLEGDPFVDDLLKAAREDSP